MAEYIERKAAIDFIQENKCKKCSDIGLCGGCAVLTAIKLFQTVPATDVAPVRHGVWVPTPCPGIENGYLVVCSKCKAEIYVSNDFNPSNYCPNCGTQMDGGVDDA